MNCDIHTPTEGLSVAQGAGTAGVVQTQRKMCRILMGAAVAALGVVVFHPSSASAQSGTKVGMLSCKMGPSVGLIVGSSQRMACQFTSERGPTERYEARMTRIGLDLGITAGGVMNWAVYAPTNGIPYGALAGSYAGASGDIALGVGVGANAMIGGSQKSIALQPLSLEGQVGVNVALGAAGFTLRSVQ